MGMDEDPAGVSMLVQKASVVCTLVFAPLCSPVGGTVLNMTPTLPLRKDPHRRSGTSKGVKLNSISLFSNAVSMDLQSRDGTSVWCWSAGCVCRYQPIVLPTVVVPEGLVLSLVLNAELNQM